MFNDAEIAEAMSVMRNIVRVGTVTATDDEKVTARVEFKDRSGIVSHELKILVKNSLKNKDYWMPDINEQVLCLFLPIGIEKGWVLGSFYSNVTTANADDKKYRKVFFEDGSSAQYDRESHTLTVDVPAEGGNLVINTEASVTVNTKTATLNASEKATVNSPAIDLGEGASLEPSVLGDKLAAWISGTLKDYLDDHTHPAGTPYTGPAKSGTIGPFSEGAGASGGNVYSTKNKNQ